MRHGLAGPLAGVVVVDMTRALAGPYCTMLLADLGARVIKVEPPTGDRIRRQGPFDSEDQLRDFGGYFQSVNRNKQGLGVDLRSPRGISVIRHLASRADVVVENFRSGVMEEMGLSYESLHEDNPRLVYGALRGFGDARTGASPYDGRPAYDILVQAMSGIMQITGQPDGPPTKVGPGVGDIFTGALLAVGILAALHDARKTGAGRFVDVAMYDAMISLAERTVYQHSYVGEVPGREGNEHPMYTPVGVFRARDGWVTISATTEKQWAKLCRTMGRPELLNDPEFLTPMARNGNKARVRELIESWTADLDKSAVTDLLAEELPAGPVNDVADLMADPHVAARRMVVELDHPGLHEPRRVAGQPVKFTGSGPGEFHRAPLLGEDTRTVLADFYATHEVEDLLRTGAVFERERATRPDEGRQSAHTASAAADTEAAER